MPHHDKQVTFQGKPLALVGTLPMQGDPAPDVAILGNDLAHVRISDFRGKVCVILTMPSLDTPVCDTETRRFNQEAAGLGPDIVVLAVSMDLPFAQKRWCGAAGVEAVRTLSDHRQAELGQAYGVLIRDLRLLARAVFVVGRQGKISYVQLVKEITSEPDYDAVLDAIRSAAGRQA